MKKHLQQNGVFKNQLPINMEGNQHQRGSHLHGAFAFQEGMAGFCLCVIYSTFHAIISPINAY